MLNKCFRTQKFQRTSQLLDCSGKVNAFFLTYKLLMLFLKTCTVIRHVIPRRPTIKVDISAFNSSDEL